MITSDALRNQPILTGQRVRLEPLTLDGRLGRHPSKGRRILGEAVLNELDPDKESVNYRVWLAGPQVFGQGNGTQITRLVLDYALYTVGLPRASLSVYAFNSRAQRVYEKCGFSLRAVYARRFAGMVSGMTSCSWPCSTAIPDQTGNSSP